MSDVAKKPRIRVAEAVESGVEGLLLFLVRYFQTGFGVLLTPRRTSRKLLTDRHAPKPGYVLPFTYLSVGLFLLSLMGQVAGISIVDWIWYDDDLANKVTDALSKEVSLVKVAVHALPGVLMVAGFAAIVRLGLRHFPMSRRLVTFSLSYAFGAQAWGLFVTTFSFVVIPIVLEQWAPQWGPAMMGLATYVFIACIMSGLAVSFLGPLAFVLSALRWRRMWRTAKWHAAGIALTVATAISVGHVAVLAAMKLPADVIARSGSPTSPELRIAEVTATKAGATVDLKLGILLRNRSAKPQGWEMRKLAVRLFDPGENPSTHCSGSSLDFKVSRVLDGTGAQAQYLSIPPGEARWLSATASTTLQSAGRKLFEQPRQWGVAVSLSSIDNDKAAACSTETLDTSKR